MPDRPTSATRERQRGSALVEFWARHGSLSSGVVTAVLAAVALSRLRQTLPHQLWDRATWSAIDLKYRHAEVTTWFSGSPVYGAVDGAVYPPASQTILWPFIGWLELEPARFAWAVTTLGATAVVALVAWVASRPARPLERLLIVGLVFAAYPLQHTLFVGQAGMLAVALVAAGALLLFRERATWWMDAIAGLLLATSLVKPTLTLPIVAVAIIAAGRWGPALYAAATYLILSLIAAAAQPGSLFSLMGDWFETSSERVSWMEGVPSVHLLLGSVGLEGWMLPASLIVLAALLGWTWHVRAADPWLLLGAAAIVARIWSHSRLYDDAILLLAAIALFRVIILSHGRTRALAITLFALAALAFLTPIWVFYGSPALTLTVTHTIQAILWTVVLIVVAWHATCRSEGSIPPFYRGPSVARKV